MSLSNASELVRNRKVSPVKLTQDCLRRIAAQIGTAENTVKVHRSRAMEKMKASSLADLVKMIERLQIPLARAS